MTGILIVGGTGVFGSRLAEGLIADGIRDVVIASRTARTGQALAARLGCISVTLDRDDPALELRLTELAPDIIIDAAGPFQAYGRDPYRLARAGIAAGAHVLDFSDDGAFTAGITDLDKAAKAKGSVVRSGVSSVPAISAAVVRALSEEFQAIERIDCAILPGNRAPRGRSVMAAILAQIGRPLAHWPGAKGWLGAVHLNVPGSPLRRLASPIGAPDLHVFPRAFAAKEVRFRAGLELQVMHRGLAVLAWLHTKGLFPNPVGWTSGLHKAATLLEPFGTDTGAMVVSVICKNPDGTYRRSSWSLRAEGGNGPSVPALPARVLCAKLRRGLLASGAEPALFDLDLEDVRSAAPELGLQFHQEEVPWFPAFAQVLGREAFAALPDAVRDLHDVTGRRRFEGSVTVARTSTFPGRLIARLFGFPGSGEDLPITVDMVREEGAERWTRRIGPQVWTSYLTPDPSAAGRIWERFGPFRFAIDLKAGEDGLHFPVSAGRLAGVPMPRWMLPKSDTVESVDTAGRATFDVRLAVPFLGQIVRYTGWLVPSDQPIMGDQPPSDSS